MCVRIPCTSRLWVWRSVYDHSMMAATCLVANLRFVDSLIKRSSVVQQCFHQSDFEFVAAIFEESSE